MRLTAKISRQAICAAAVGGMVGYFFVRAMPLQTASEMLQALGNLAIIAGSLVGWSVGWIAQSRELIRDVDYHSARETFRQLGALQIEIIQRWVIVFVCSVVTIVGAVLMRIPNLGCHWYVLLLLGSSALLGIALTFILYFFQGMLELSRLKTELEELERSQLRKKRLLPDPSPAEAGEHAT